VIDIINREVRRSEEDSGGVRRSEEDLKEIKRSKKNSGGINNVQ